MPQPETASPVRVGLIGYGFVGKTFHAPLIDATEGMQLTAVGSRRAEDVLADLPDVEVIADPLDLIASDDVDVVVLASPNDTHVPLALAALEAGKHVVVDKPFTPTLAEARDVLAAAERAGRIATVFQNRRWDSDFLLVAQALKDKTVGEVRHLESHIDRFRPTVRDRWRERSGPASGLWFDLGPHLVDQALQLFGPPERVLASFALQRDGAQAVDWAHVILEYPQVRVVLHAGSLVAGGAVRFAVHGTGGSLLKRGADIQEDQLRAGLTPASPEWGVDPDDGLLFAGETDSPATVAAPRGHQQEFYARLRDAVRDSGPVPVAPHEAIAVMAVLDAAERSAQTGAAVVPDLTAAELAAWR